MKFDKPKKEYVKGANPGELDSPKLASVEFASMSEELEKEAIGLTGGTALISGITGAKGLGAVGAGLGAMGGMAHGAMTAKPGESRAGAILKGGLKGGALGAGVGAAGGAALGTGVGAFAGHASKKALQGQASFGGRVAATPKMQQAASNLRGALAKPGALPFGMKLSSATVYSSMSLELEKEALGMPGAIKGMSYMGKRLAGGTAAGALAGGAAGAAAGGEGNRLKGALGGAVGGAALGAGAGYVAPRVASHMAAGKTLGQAAKGVGGDIAAGARGLKNKAVAPARRAQSNKAITEAGRVTNPTQQSSARFHQSLKDNVSPEVMGNVKKAIPPEMAAMGMTPEAAAQLMNMGSKAGEGFATSAGRQIASQASRGVAGAPIRRIARDAATGAASPLAKAASIAFENLSPQGRSQRRAAESVGKLIKHLKEKKSSSDSPYMLDQLHIEPKIRKFKAEAPEVKHRVKQAMLPTSGMGASKNINDPAKRLAESQKVGVPEMQTAKVKPVNTKIAFSESAYSGGTGNGPLRNYASHIPAFVSPPVKTAGPPSEDDGKESKEERKSHRVNVARGLMAGGTLAGAGLGALSGKKRALMGAALGLSAGTVAGFRYAAKDSTKQAAMADELAKLNAITSPQSQLGKTQRIGAPKVTAPSGPSIQQVAKPVGPGSGTPQPGATKSGAI